MLSKIKILSITGILITLIISTGIYYYILSKNEATHNFNRLQLTLVKTAGKGIEADFNYLEARLEHLNNSVYIQYIRAPYTYDLMRWVLENDSTGLISEVFRVDSNGTLTARMYKGSKFLADDTEWYRHELFLWSRAPQNRGRITYGQVFYKSAREQLLVVIPTYQEMRNPHVKSAGKQFAGFLGFAINAHQLLHQHLSHCEQISFEGFTAVMEGKGQFIYHSQIPWLIGTYADSVKVVTEKKHDNIFALTSRRADGAQVVALPNRITGKGTVAELIAWTTIYKNNLNWLLTFHTPYSAVVEKSKEIFFRNLVIIIALLVVVIWGSWLMLDHDRLRAQVQGHHILKASEEKYRLLFLNSPFPMFVYDPDTFRILSANKATVDHYGYSEEELVLMTITQLRPPEDIPLLLRYVAGRDPRQQYAGHWRHLRKDGSIIDVEIYSDEILFEGKKLRLVLAKDITEQQKTEEQLKLSGQILEKIGTIVLVANFFGKIIYANPSVKEMLGYEIEEIKGDGWWNLIHDNEEQREKSKKYVSECAAGIQAPITEPYEKVIRDKLGRLHHILWQDTPGPKGLLIGVGHDITEKKLAEEQLHEKEYRFKTLFENSTDAIYVSTLDGKFIECNQAMVNLFEYPLQELMQLEVSKIYYYPEEREQLVRLFNEKGNLKDHEVKMQKKNGEVIDCLISCAAWRDIKGGLIGFHGIIKDITEKKKAEDELTKAREFTQSIIDNIPEVVYSVDNNMNLKYISPAFADIYEYSDRDFYNNPKLWIQCVHPDDVARVQDDVRRILKGAGTYRSEYRIVTKSKKIKWIVDKGKSFFDKEGKLLRFDGTMTDVTESVKAKEAVEQSERRYRKLVETMEEGLLYVDNEGIIQFANQKFCDMLGYSKEELIGAISHQTFLSDEGRRLLEEKHQERLRGISSEYELPLKKKSGEWIWASINGTPVTDENGNIIGSMGTHLDVTEKKKTEDALRQSEHKYRQLIEKAGEVIYTTDILGNFTYGNPKCEQLTGYTTEELIGKHFSLLISPEWKNKIIAIYKAQFEERKKETVIEFPFVSKSGEIKWVTQTAILLEENNQPVGFHCVLHDITDRKILQDKLIQKNQELDTFMYKASHDLKGPLASVMGLTNVAKYEIRDQKAMEYFDLIEKSTRRLDSILMDLIQITCISQGKIEKTAIQFNDFIKDIMKSLSNVKGYNEITFRIKVQQEKPFYCDDKLLRSVLQNLIENTIKYRKERSKDSFTSINVQETNSNGITIEVTDNGIGIGREHQKKVFDMFYRATSSSMGTGLGLFIVKSAIDKLGGNVELKSAEKLGSTFTVYLPNMK